MIQCPPAVNTNITAECGFLGHIKEKVLNKHCGKRFADYIKTIFISTDVRCVGFSFAVKASFFLEVTSVFTQVMLMLLLNY